MFYTTLLYIIHHIHQDVFRKHLLFPFAQIAMFLESKLMPAVYKNIPLVTISNSSKNDIAALDWVNDSNIEVISPGINTSSFIKIRKTKDPSFVYIGRLKPWKNIDLIIKAFSIINKKYPTAKLTIAGFGESLASLQMLTKKLKLEEKIIFAGKVEEDEKFRLFGRSWAAIQPSSFEGWGITVIEANAAGTPVIASNIHGLKDSVLNNRTGILFQLKNEEALFDAIEKIINNSDMRNRMSEEAIIWARGFAWEYSAESFEKFIFACVSKNTITPAYEYLQS